MLSAVGLVYGLAAFTPTRVLNGRSGTPLHTHTGFWGALAAAAWSPEASENGRRTSHAVRLCQATSSFFIKLKAQILLRYAVYLDANTARAGWFSLDDSDRSVRFWHKWRGGGLSSG